MEIDADSYEVNLRDYYLYYTPLTELNTKIGYFKVPAGNGIHQVSNSYSRTGPSPPTTLNRTAITA